MRKLISFACALILSGCWLIATPVASGQGVGTSGSISGTVTDPQGGVLPKASVVAVEMAQGTQYSATTDETGQYRLTSLLPGTYKVTVKIDRFETQAMTGVVVNVGETVSLDVHLKLATTSQTVEVSAIPPVVETERGSHRPPRLSYFYPTTPGGLGFHAAGG